MPQDFFFLKMLLRVFQLRPLPANYTALLVFTSHATIRELLALPIQYRTHEKEAQLNFFLSLSLLWSAPLPSAVPPGGGQAVALTGPTFAPSFSFVYHAHNYVIICTGLISIGLVFR